MPFSIAAIMTRSQRGNLTPEYLTACIDMRLGDTTHRVAPGKLGEPFECVDHERDHGPVAFLAIAAVLRRTGGKTYVQTVQSELG
ncbi:MAG TPA: hypothetical protein VE224_13605 [Pseudolabrys sp.]|nr:hypothetical protein [Pseudolabrys sp.]